MAPARDAAAAAGDTDEATAREHERAPAEHIIDVMRKALHRVLEG